MYTAWIYYNICRRAIEDIDRRPIRGLGFGNAPGARSVQGAGLGG
jgi:hypothetical protein